MQRTWPTLSDVARNVAAALTEDDIDWAIRFLCDGVGRLEHAAEAGQLNEAVARPPSTGSVQWDTLLAAAIAWKLRAMGQPVPAWAAEVGALKLPWTPMWVSYGKWNRDLAGTPPEWRALNIVWHERNLWTKVEAATVLGLSRSRR